MEHVLGRWQSRIDRSEAKLRETFQFRNRTAPIVVVDTSYWTFGDLPAEIPDEYYTDPASAFRCQMAKIARHLENTPDDDYIPFLHPWFLGVADTAP